MISTWWNSRGSLLFAYLSLSLSLSIFLLLSPLDIVKYSLEVIRHDRIKSEKRKTTSKRKRKESFTERMIDYARKSFAFLVDFRQLASITKDNDESISCVCVCVCVCCWTTNIDGFVFFRRSVSFHHKNWTQMWPNMMDKFDSFVRLWTTPSKQTINITVEECQSWRSVEHGSVKYCSQLLEFTVDQHNIESYVSWQFDVQLYFFIVVWRTRVMHVGCIY
jgi:hypothetical protein